MKKTEKSISYDDAAIKLTQATGEQRYRELWKCIYASRHVRMNPSNQLTLNNIGDALDNTELLLKKYGRNVIDPNNGNENEYINQLLNFSYGLIYALHKLEHADGFTDLRFEEQVPEYANIIKKLAHTERSTVNHLYELTHQLGFLIIELYLPQNTEDLSKSFINSYPQDPPNLPFYPNFPFPQKESGPKGIQISLPPYTPSIDDNWDLVIFYNDKEAIDHIRTKVGRAWNLDGRKTIGNKNDHQIALYVDRKSSNKTNVVTALELQIGLQDFNHHGRIALHPENKDNPKFYEYFSNPNHYPKNFLSNTIDSVRLGEELLEKRWNVNKNNIRRAIGIFHWDKINTLDGYTQSRKSLLTKTIDYLRNDRPEILELYYGNFNTPASAGTESKLGDLRIAEETIIRGMEADYDLTTLCIEKADYCSPPHDKRKTNKY